ncbi:MAG TPA: HD domain-containing phosphohydrolase [Candidatus Dormibacteraeota bacterium]|jgi:HD-GYP domain-containing protein (c-di-GMP phosphodiesterase class II)|nr:HD domain-containing phosphohydrolase [Candidatus Dormibacteraeota bacterium]
MKPPEQGVRLSELIAALSLATDLGMGQPMEKAMRGCLLALALARRLDADAETLRDLYYLALLQHIGCTSHAHEWAGYVGGDEIAMRTHAVTFANSPPSEFMSGFIRHAGEGLPLPKRAALVTAMMREGNKRFAFIATTQCEAAVCLAQQMEMPPGVLTGLAQGLETWNGKGGPARLKGDDLSLPVRVLAVAHDAEVFERVGGLDACIAAVRKRRGSAYDPLVADAFLADAGGMFHALPDASLWDPVIEAEPEPHVRVAEYRVDAMARAFGDFIDLKLPFTIGHSSGVAALAEVALVQMNGGGADAGTLRRAALMHDIGRVAIPNGTWEKPGPLNTPEWERVRLHAYYGERILSRPLALREVAALASAHHERQDGSGYHRGSVAAQLPAAARVLAAADAYQAMTQERPHRPARAADEAALELRGEAEAGRLDRKAVECVLEAAGHARERIRAELPAGLSEREVEVLRHLCMGRTNRQVAERLSIAEKTVGHHVEHIYNKIGRSTRAGAALFAMENGLV